MCLFFEDIFVRVEKETPVIRTFLKYCTVGLCKHPFIVVPKPSLVVFIVNISEIVTNLRGHVSVMRNVTYSRCQLIVKITGGNGISILDFIFSLVGLTRNKSVFNAFQILLTQQARVKLQNREIRWDGGRYE